MTTRLRAVVISLVATVLLVSCGGDGSDRSDGNVAGSGSGSTAVVAGGFTASLVGGGQFDGSTPRARPLAVWFWAPT